MRLTKAISYTQHSSLLRYDSAILLSHVGICGNRRETLGGEYGSSGTTGYG
jgi:hypothetical protein